MAVHTSSWDNTSKRIGYQKYLELHVAALNEAVAGLPPDRMRMHICWGNYEGPHHMDVDLTEVLPAVFEARPAAIVFEAANPRHEHEWEDLGKLKIPDDKVLIPGVVDVKTNVLEHPRLVAQRIGRFADIAAGSASSPAPTAGSARSSASAPSTTLSPGLSSAPSPRAHGSPPNASGGNA